jgi:branched-chain amino acid aminotransferase
MTTIVSVDGQIGPLEMAQISIFDRGFLYGDSVYEVIRTYDGVPFELERHLIRLEESAGRIAMKLPVSCQQLSEEVLAAHRASQNKDSYVRVVVTRGSGPIGLDIALASDQRRFVVAKPLEEVRPKASVYEEGVKIALVSVRRNLQTAIDPQAKTGNYLNSVMALVEARKKGAFEAIMLGHRGNVTEGSSSNIFAVVGGILLTPPVDAGILKGITRTVVLEIARSQNMKVLELPITSDVLLGADEAFITSSIREIVPVVQVDDQILGTGKPGPVVAQIRALFKSYVQTYVEANR